MKPNRLIDLIEQIKPRPAMYLSRHTISALRSFIDGWLLGSPNNTLEYSVLENFQDWIVKKFEVRGTQSWDRIILFYSQDEAHALDQFFELFDEFQEI